MSHPSDFTPIYSIPPPVSATRTSNTQQSPFKVLSATFITIPEDMQDALLHRWPNRLNCVVPYTLPSFVGHSGFFFRVPEDSTIGIPTVLAILIQLYLSFGWDRRAVKDDLGTASQRCSLCCRLRLGFLFLLPSSYKFPIQVVLRLRGLGGIGWLLPLAPVYDKAKGSLRATDGFRTIENKFSCLPQSACTQIEGQIFAPIKTGQAIRGTTAQIEEKLAFDRDLLSYHQTAEWASEMPKNEGIPWRCVFACTICACNGGAGADGDNGRGMMGDAGSYLLLGLRTDLLRTSFPNMNVYMEYCTTITDKEQQELVRTNDEELGR
ncbi:hypothetical protein DFH08DRAFT_806307 [Mycena albidolilacea]|uniref:Uncharacterized protein n=1 Tax=Mycena albidolilacea TaxID=1033008 RepID=A0AAD7ETX0_9AGAR|nr:hypothetical protein DFH08DRAFT_806307 [Mycena albidolilacea]